MSWEPEDGRCRDCNAPLETEDEQLTGYCSFCPRDEDDDAYDDDLINEFYSEHGHF